MVTHLSTNGARRHTAFVDVHNTVTPLRQQPQAKPRDRHLGAHSDVGGLTTMPPAKSRSLLYYISRIPTLP